MSKMQHDDTGIASGRNAVREALKSGRPIDCLYIARGGHSGSIGGIIALAKERGIPVKEVDSKKLDDICGGAVHQGIAASAAAVEYSSLDDVFALGEKRGEKPFIIIADGLEDVHNLGAVIRVAECAGAHGVIIPERHGAGLTAAVGRASAGAVEYVPIVRVKNIAAAIEELKKRGVWVYAADMDGQNWCETDFTGPCAVVIGSEGSGVGRLIKEKSDFTVSLPLKGQINSLNASVACGIICYEVVRQRGGFSCL